MPWGFAAAAIGTVAGAAISANAAGDAADQQAESAAAGIGESRRQFDLVQSLLKPYVDAGTNGLSQYEQLAGLRGRGPQQAQIGALQRGAEYKTLTRQGENAILANASATGGLRGGNVQGSLADYRTNLLSSLIERQLTRSGGLAQQGQNSAARVGSAALTTGQQVSGLLQQQGAALAGGQIAGANAIGSAVGSLGGIAAGALGTGGGGAGMSGVQAGFSNTSVGSSGFGTGLAYGNQDMGAYF
jgi:hypothetical protein